MKTTPRTALFGPYTLDLRSGELRKFGTKVKIGEQTFQILRALLETPGELVSRDELQAKIWAGDTFVDFDHGLNSAIQRLRDCLSDSAEKPRWIETIPRRGYRFVGQVEWQEGNGAAPAGAKESEPPRTAVALGAAPQAVERETRGWVVVAAILILLAAGLAIGYRTWKQSAKRQAAKMIRSLGVLPIENLSGDPSQDYFADGMTDELITALAKNRSLRVVSRTSAMRYKGVQRPVRDIAHELGVDGIVEGSVSRNANRVHMTVQLVYAPTDTHVWAESYDRDFNQALSLPEELSQTVAKEVKTAILPAPSRRYINPEAHDAYLRGRDFWFDGDNTHSLVYFRKAIQLQPDYAAAWSGIADSYRKFALTDERPVREVAADFEAAARKAVALDDSSSEAHCSFAAWYFFLAWDLPHADAESRRATELDPNYSEAHHLRSYVLAAMNRPEQSLQEAKRAIELDPFRTPWGLGYAYIQTRQIDAAINDLRMRDQTYPEDVDTKLYLAEAYWLKGMGRESAEALEKGLELMGDPEKADAVHRAFQRGGQKAVAQWRVDSDKTRVRREYISSYFHARQYAYLGNKNATLKLLDLAYYERSPWLMLIQNEPIFDFVHSDRRYQALVGKLGLTPSY